MNKMKRSKLEHLFRHQEISFSIFFKSYYGISRPWNNKNYFLDFLLFYYRINALEEQLETQKVSTGKQVEEESLRYKTALVSFDWGLFDQSVLILVFVLASCGLPWVHLGKVLNLPIK